MPFLSHDDRLTVFARACLDSDVERDGPQNDCIESVKTIATERASGTERVSIAAALEDRDVVIATLQCESGEVPPIPAPMIPALTVCSPQRVGSSSCGRGEADLGARSLQGCSVSRET